MTKHNQRIHLSIGFGDTILPIINCDDGHQRIPLKPISDQIGLNWKGQKRKLLNDGYLIERFGLILGVASYPQFGDQEEKREEYLIRLDRVTAFLNILNPRQITARGNQEAADWLKAKHEEWDDALHAYETNGFAAKPARSAQCVVNMIAQIDRIKNPTLKQIAAQLANEELGLEIPMGKQQNLEASGL